MVKSICSTSLIDGKTSVKFNKVWQSIQDWACPNGHIQSIVYTTGSIFKIECPKCSRTFYSTEGKYQGDPYVSHINM